MKTADILQEDIPWVEKNRRPLQLSKRHKVLGQGKMGLAQQHARNPNVVIKTSNIYEENPTKDEYVQFIDLALSHQDNPFFPRIHKAKIVYDPKYDGYQLVVMMEKLIPLQNEKIKDVVPQLMRQLGITTRKPLDRSTKRIDTGFQNFKQTITVSNLWYWFSKPANRAKLRRETKNPELKQAMELLEPYIKKFGQDLHTGNMMVRLTGTGPQLVIIDPLVPQTDV